MPLENYGQSAIGSMLGIWKSIVNRRRRNRSNEGYRAGNGTSGDDDL